MEMINVLAKLREISEKSPEMSHAIDNVNRMTAPVSEGIEIKTSGDDAILAQILKLAGMVGGQNTPDMSAGPGDAPGMGMSGPGSDPFASDMGSDPMADLGKAMGGDPLGGNLGAPPMGGKSMEKPMGLGKLGGIGVPAPKMHMDKPDMDMDMDKGMDKDPFDDPVDDAPGMGAIAAGEGTSNRPYPNSPHEVTKGISAAIPKGQDLNRPKMTAPKVAGGDNPMHVAVTFD